MKKILLSALFLVGCATPYQGPLPDLSLRGDAAQKEYNQFHLDDSFWVQGHFYLMGPQGDKYTMGSMRPVIEKVSARALEDHDKAQLTSNVQWISLGVALAALTAGSMTSERNTYNAIALTSALFSIGAGVMSVGYTWSATTEFNEDRRSS